MMLNLTHKANLGFPMRLRARSRVDLQHPPVDSEPAVEPENLWDLIRPFAKKYRWLLGVTALLNALPGLGIAFQTVRSKISGG